TPHLRRDPVIAYMPDNFQKPYPLDPTVVVDVGSVLDKIAAMLCCHESQFFEWLPYNNPQVIDAPDWQVPAGTEARRAWMTEQVKSRLRPRADKYRELLIKLHGCERSSKIEYVEAFEGCEYGSLLDDKARQRLFPFVK